jgi:putative membrane protein
LIFTKAQLEAGFLHCGVERDQTKRRRDKEMDGMIGWGPFGMIGMFFNLLVFVGLLALIAWGVPRILSARQGGEQADSAEEILRQRFARGEINVEEYERSYEALRKDSPRKDYEDYVREAKEQLRDEGAARREEDNG